MFLFNTMTQVKERFEPLGNPVTLYVCGVTPYDTGHLGHAFTYLSFDVLHRYLRYLGHRVVYVQNLTDVDDDMLRRARETGEDFLELGNRNVTAFLACRRQRSGSPPERPARRRRFGRETKAASSRLTAYTASAASSHGLARISAPRLITRPLPVSPRPIAITTPPVPCIAISIRVALPG